MARYFLTFLLVVSTIISQDSNYNSSPYNESKKKHGEWKYFDDYGKLEKIINYENGEILSETHYGYNNPNKWLSSETLYVDEKVRNQKRIAYFNSGQIEKIVNYSHFPFTKNGKYIKYYENGNIFVDRIFKLGRPYGKLIVYFKDGTIMKKGNFENDYGYTMYYNKAGKFIGMIHYIDSCMMPEPKGPKCRLEKWQGIDVFYDYKNGEIKKINSILNGDDNATIFIR